MPATTNQNETSEEKAKKFGLWANLTKWMKNLADPSKDLQQSFMSVLGSVVEWVVGAIATLFKPLLGSKSESQIKTFSHYAGKAFTRVMNDQLKEKVGAELGNLNSGVFPGFNAFRDRTPAPEMSAPATASCSSEAARPSCSSSSMSLGG